MNVYKKLKFYFPMLFVLWCGAFLQRIDLEMERYERGLAIEAIQTDCPQVLLEKEYDGKLSQTEMEQEASLLLAFYQGEMVKEIIGDNFYSFYGFSDKIKNYVVSDDEKINLNLVITYNEKQDVTKILWASPFYNEDF